MDMYTILFWVGIVVVSLLLVAYWIGYLFLKQALIRFLNN